MRTTELAKVAANAEKLRLQALARRQVMRVVYGAVAAVFGLGALVLVHVIIYLLLRLAMAPIYAALIVLVVDLAVVVVAGILALRSVPGPVEIEAAEIRRKALSEMRTSLTIMGMIGPATRLLGGRRSTGLALGAVAARLFARR